MQEGKRGDIEDGLRTCDMNMGYDQLNHIVILLRLRSPCSVVTPTSVGQLCSHSRKRSIALLGRLQRQY